MKGLFCQEIRAYSVNMKLLRQGLEFENKEAKNDLASHVYNSYVKKYGVAYSDDQIRQIEKDCLGFRSFADFMSSIAPTGQSTHTVPAAR